MAVLSYVRMVLWSFIGIRRRAAANEEQAKVKPLAIIAVALVLVGLLMLTLWCAANLAVHTLHA